MRGFARESARSKGKGRKRGLNRDPSYLLTSRPACFHNGGTTLSLILVHDSGSNVRISRNKEEIKSIEKASIFLTRFIFSPVSNSRLESCKCDHEANFPKGGGAGQPKLRCPLIPRETSIVRLSAPCVRGGEIQKRAPALFRRE